VKLLSQHPGHAEEHTPAHVALEKEMGFAYRTLLGEPTLRLRYDLP
jgi:hypothetical protein